MKHFITIFFFILASFLLGRYTAPPNTRIITQAVEVDKRPEKLDYDLVEVIDGNTIKIIYKEEYESVRLLRINTPERGQDGYIEAKLALENMLGGEGIRLEFEKPGQPERDENGQLLAYVFSDGSNVNVDMVRLGHSKFWTKYGEGRYENEFRRAEEHVNIEKEIAAKEHSIKYMAKYSSFHGRQDFLLISLLRNSSQNLSILGTNNFAVLNRCIAVDFHASGSNILSRNSSF